MRKKVMADLGILCKATLLVMCIIWNIILVRTEEKQASAGGLLTQGVSVIKEIPTIRSTENTYAMISTLDNEDTWISGKFDKSSRTLTDSDDYLSLSGSFPVESDSFRVSINNTSYRMIVNKFNKKEKYLGYTDLCNGDILHLDPSVKYITITIYKYKSRQQLNHSDQDMLADLKNGLRFSITKLEDLAKYNHSKELLTSEIHIESLSNYYNFRSGWFKSWGGAYENLEGSLCTRNLYQVDAKTYIFNVNDSRISLSITEFDAKGNWVKFNGPLTNGDSFKKQPKTKYIGLSIKSLKWGADLFSLFENGLRIDLASNQYMTETSTKEMDSIDLSDAEHWKIGSYLYETGEYIIDPDKISFDSFCRLGTKEYMVNLPGGDLMMKVLELNRDGRVISSSDLQSGQKWKKAKDTDKIAITVFDYDKALSLADYKKIIAAYPKFGLKEYERYDHNTVMKDITAGEFVNAINVGWNLGNSLDSMGKTSSNANNLNQEIFWGNPYVTKDLIDYVADCGFNTIRIPVTWNYNTYLDENMNLKISKDWLNRVQDVVDYGIANDLYVIINTHHEQPIIYAGADSATMRKVIKDAGTLWTEIAEHFKTYDEHLIFEAYNEVDNIENYWNYGDKAAAQMNELNQAFVTAVRSTGGNNTNRVLIVPTLLDRMDTRFYDAFQLPKDTVPNKIVVQVHTYSQKIHQDIEGEFIELDKFSDKIHTPIIIGEFGSTTSYPFPELREEHASNFVARAAKYGIKCIWWDNGSEYQIIDRRNTAKSDKKMIKALLEGSDGIGYQLEKEMIINSPKQFAYKMPNVVTGKLETKYWGTLTTDKNGDAIPVKGGSLCTISLKAVNEVAGVWLQRLLFYDAKGNLVKNGKEIQSRYYIGTVPDGAVAMRVSINSPNSNISRENYDKALNNGDIELSVGCFRAEDLKKIQLKLKPFQ